MTTRAAVSDDEFIELWEKHKSVSKLSAILGVAIRNVQSRRRRLEVKYNKQLNAGDWRGAKYGYLAPREHPARLHLDIREGTILVFSDAHFWPEIRSTAFKGLLKCIKDMKPRAVICNGDAFDGARASRHARIGWDATPTIVDELRACKDRLGEIAEAAKGVKLFWPLGNHDARFSTRLAALVPEFQNVKGFQLKDHFPGWEPCWSVWLNNDVWVKHRYRNGIHATHTNIMNTGMSTVTGHLHSLKVTPFTNARNITWGVDTGTLADPNGPQFIDYTEDTGGLNHRSGFAVLTFHNGQLLWPELVYARAEGQVEFRGKVFDVGGE